MCDALGAGCLLAGSCCTAALVVHHHQQLELSIQAPASGSRGMQGSLACPQQLQRPHAPSASLSCSLLLHAELEALLAAQRAQEYSGQLGLQQGAGQLGAIQQRNKALEQQVRP